MISQTAEYALRAIVHLAARPDEPLTVQQIGTITHVPSAYLAKIMQSLTRARLVHSQRGSGGGFTLLVRPDVLTVLDVVNIIDPVPRITSCPLDLPQHCEYLCPLHKRLDEAAELVENAFRRTTISELLADPNPSRMLGLTVATAAAV